MTSSTENNIVWNSLVALTILLGCGVTILILGKDHYLPELYASNHTLQSTEDISSPAHNSSPVVEDPKAYRVIEFEPEPEIRNTKPNITDGRYVLVAGSFLSEERALKFISDFKDKVEDVSPEILPITHDQSTYYRVIVLHANTIGEMTNRKREIERAGYTDSWIYKN